MSTAYRAIDWNPQKRRYDLSLLALLVLALGLFCGVSLRLSPHFTVETLILRGTALAAFLLLHVILSIGPLARLDPRFLPLLYNRRHLGVTLFLLGVLHTAFATIQFHALGNENPLMSLFTAYSSDYRLIAQGHSNLAHLPFEPFGAAALLIFFLLAATSHDFWLRNLGPSVWKTLHLGVYLAYGLVLAHVAWGVLQTERNPVYVLLVAVGFVTVTGLHLAAARKEQRQDTQRSSPADTDFIDVCTVSDLREGRGKVVVVQGQRIAVFRHQNRVFATSNVCRHQGGPLGEGRIIDGCITCPWHGWNYQPEDGCSPPPFTERIPTFETRIEKGRVWIHPKAHPLAQRTAGAKIPDASGS